MEEEDIQRRGPPQSDTPGGDCKSLCVRHQRMANGGTNLMLQKSIENLPPNEQQIVNTVWSLFSSSPSRRRLLILRGLLTIACPSQLTFLQDNLTLEMRLDPIEVLPREVSLKLFSYLDAISLGRAAQVSKSWRAIADDDVLWRTMCEQHIERKCEKCGWGLPLLGSERRRRSNKSGASSSSSSKPSATASTTTTSTLTSADLQPLTSIPQPTSTNRPSNLSTIFDSETWGTIPSPLASPNSMSVDRPSKRSKTHSPATSRSSTPAPGSPRSRSRSSSSGNALATRPWKQVYCERLAIERNWRRGKCVASVLAGHTDSITCLQVAEDLPHPQFPVLMTGSWDRSVRIWNLESGKEVGVLRGHTRGVRALQFDAVKLITGSMDSTLKIWNWRTGECMRTLRGHRDAVICLAYDKQLLVSGSADSTIRVWDFGTGEVYTLRGHTEWVNSVALWDSTKAGSGSGGCSDAGEVSQAISDPELARLSAKGKFLVSASDDMTIRVWDLYTRECVRVLSGHVAQVQSVRVIAADPTDNNSVGGTTTTSTRASFPTSILQPAVTSPATLDTSASSGPSCLSPSSFLPEQLSTLSSSASTTTSTATPIPAVIAPLNLAVDAPRPLVVSASLDNTIKVWDVEQGECQKTLFGHIEGVWDVDVDKLRIVSASHDRTLKIWDKDSGRCLHTLVGHTSAVTALTLQDQYIVSGGDDGNARVWRFS
ncbi:WD40 repeat-like protein [Meredithblackwellia eburnea MCA 4105]